MDCNGDNLGRVVFNLLIHDDELLLVIFLLNWLE